MSRVVMIGNFDFYTTDFVDWTELCSRQGEVWIVLMDHSRGAETLLKDRAKLCKSSQCVEGVLAVVSGNYKRLVRSLEPDLVFVEPGWLDAQEIEEWAESEGYSVIRSRLHQKPAQAPSLLF